MHRYKLCYCRRYGERGEEEEDELGFQVRRIKDGEELNMSDLKE
jgi:hypothetical protein